MNNPARYAEVMANGGAVWSGVHPDRRGIDIRSVYDQNGVESRYYDPSTNGAAQTAQPVINNQFAHNLGQQSPVKQVWTPWEHQRDWVEDGAWLANTGTQDGDITHRHHLHMTIW